MRRLRFGWALAAVMFWLALVLIVADNSDDPRAGKVILSCIVTWFAVFSTGMAVER